MSYPVIDATLSPQHQLQALSQYEVEHILSANEGELARLFRSCALAVLNCGSPLDDGRELMARYPKFRIEVVQRQRGIKLLLFNAPEIAFVDGQLIHNIREHLFAVLRDVLYVKNKVLESPRFDLQHHDDISNAVFHILRNAQLFIPGSDPDLVVCWGGHSIGKIEYQYTKDTGYEMGLRDLNIVTGCGPGAMKGPMKGATIGHAKQRRGLGRYIGLTEPGIIAAESPNPIVNQLVILPDIEKRLEAFVRLGHGFIVFPGGVGTAEEVLYLLGILLHPNNQDVPFPLVFTGPAESASYFEQLDAFIVHCLGESARESYEIVVNDPVKVARIMRSGMKEVREYRKRVGDAYHFNWSLYIDPAYQHPFKPTHANMAGLDLHWDQPAHKLAAHLRCAFSGIVAGNVKEDGVQAIAEHGPFELHGDAELMQAIDKLLQAFVEQQRMKLPGSAYQPCYRILT